MSKGLQAFLTVLVSLVVPTLVLLAVSAATGGALAPGVAVVIGAVFGLGYGLEAGILNSYDLSTGVGWVELLVDLTWSLPNTVFGFVLGNLIYIWFGTPSRSASEGEGWVAFMPRPESTSAFGRTVLQTLGTVNIGGKGNTRRST